MAARHKFLVHEPGDMVGMAVEDVPAGAEVEALVAQSRNPGALRAAFYSARL